MTLAVFAGSPGADVGTLAGQVAAELPATVLSIAVVGDTLRVHAAPEPGPAARAVVAALAEAQLRLGRHVIVDAGSASEAACEIWRETAARVGVPMRIVEVVCGDPGSLRGPRLIVDLTVAASPIEPVAAYITAFAYASGPLNT